jgi:hypothetical protein
LKNVPAWKEAIPFSKSIIPMEFICFRNFVKNRKFATSIHKTRYSRYNSFLIITCALKYLLYYFKTCLAGTYYTSKMVIFKVKWITYWKYFVRFLLLKKDFQTKRSALNRQLVVNTKNIVSRNEIAKICFIFTDKPKCW